MKPAFEKLVPPSGQSFRCFNRAHLTTAARWHRHPEIELTYVEQGSGTRIVGDHISSYGNHDLVLIGPNLPHTWHSDDYQSNRLDLHPAMVVQFRWDFLGSTFFEAPELIGVRDMIARASRGLKFDTKTAMRIGRSISLLPHQPAASKLVDFLKCLIQLSDADSTTPLASVGFSAPPSDSLQTRTEEICAFISDQYRDSRLTHEMLASHAGMNPSAFSRFFRSATGKTAMNYISELRVSLACRLLADTDLSIAEILAYAGFRNTSNFNRQFYRLQKKSPREYRKQHRAIARNLEAHSEPANEFSIHRDKITLS